MNTTRLYAGVVAALVTFPMQFPLAALATNPTTTTALQGSASKTHKVHSQSLQGETYLQRHPKVKSAAVGAAVGTAAGAATGLITHKGIMRGAAIGAGTGAGVGLIHSSKTLNGHPMVRDGLMGTAAGMGLGLAASKGHGTGKRVVEAGAVGGAVGAAAGWLKKELK